MDVGSVVVACVGMAAMAVSVVVMLRRVGLDMDDEVFLMVALTVLFEAVPLVTVLACWAPQG